VLSLRDTLIALLITAAGPSAALGQAAILGTWRGTSICVDKINFPACHDEEVIYDVRRLAEGSDSVIVKADKIVGTAREFMGELNFGPAGPDEWRAEVQTSRYHDRWALIVADDRMIGTLVDLPSGREVRQVSLVRVTGGQATVDSTSAAVPDLSGRWQLTTPLSAGSRSVEFVQAGTRLDGTLTFHASCAGRDTRVQITLTGGVEGRIVRLTAVAGRMEGDLASVANVGAIWFAAMPGEPLHATTHGALAVLFALGARHLAQRKVQIADADADPDMAGRLREIEAQLSDLDRLPAPDGRLTDLEERLDFMERALVEVRNRAHLPPKQ
jgi:hypothetical protein